MNKIVNLDGSPPVQPDRLPIALRAYAPPPPAKPDAEPSRETRSGKPAPAIRMDARLRYRNDSRRGAAFAHRRISVPQRRRT